MRLATNEDTAQALVALIRMKEKNPSKQMQWAEPDAAAHYLALCQQHGYAVVEQGYFILFSPVRPWYSHKLFLVEDLILKIEATTAPVQVAIDALEVLRVQFDCVAIISGDTQVGYMAERYMANGYQMLGVQLIKE